jgi:dienelactone hydrolase
VDLYLPANLKPGEKRPAILISPILGGNMVVDHFARYYAGRGYIAAIVHRKKPYLTDNAPDLEGVEHYLRSSVIRLREAVDWLSARPEVDADRLGAFGVSYGAILHAVLAAVEPRIRYHVLAMPAGPLPDVIIECPDAMLAKLVRKVHEEYGWPRDKIYGELKEHIRTDPILLAPYIPKDKVQVYVAAFDRVVGARRSFGLWKAMGKPSLKVLPFGHYGGILVFPLLETQSYLAFRKHLKPAPPAPRN